MAAPYCHALGRSFGLTSQSYASAQVPPPVIQWRTMVATVLHRTTRHITSRHATSHHFTSQHATPHHITARHSTPRHCTPRHNTSHHATTPHITPRHFTSRHDTTRHNPMQGEYMTISWPEDWFAQFWSAYPRRVAKKSAWKALERVHRNQEVEFEVLIAAVKNFARSVAGNDPQYIPHPATWVNQGRWDDELPAPKPLNDFTWKALRGTYVSKYQ